MARSQDLASDCLLLLVGLSWALIAACLDQYEEGDTLTVVFELCHKRLSVDPVRYDVVRVDDCPIPPGQASTVPALTHCVVEF